MCLKVKSAPPHGPGRDSMSKHHARRRSPHSTLNVAIVLNDHLGQLTDDGDLLLKRGQPWFQDVVLPVDVGEAVHQPTLGALDGEVLGASALHLVCVVVSNFVRHAASSRWRASS